MGNEISITLDSVRCNGGLRNIPVLALAFALETILGVTGSFFALLTFGCSESVNHFARPKLDGCRDILPAIFQIFLLSINANAIVNNTECKDGLTAGYVVVPLNKLVEKCLASESFIASQLVSRALFAVIFMASVVSRAIDLPLGILAMVFSFALNLVSLDFASLNNFASRGLQIGALVPDLFCFLLKFINPRAKIESISPSPRL